MDYVICDAVVAAQDKGANEPSQFLVLFRRCAVLAFPCRFPINDFKLPKDSGPIKMDVLSKDKKALLLGNEAIVRGALEAGVSFAAAYPGTPSSEIADTFSAIAKDVGMYFEYSVNEKVSLEVCAAAAITGFRSLTCMKHVGVNVAADALLTYAYVGCKAGHVIVSADDPECHSSQNEQDNRYYATLAGLPTLEPSTPQECRDMTREGYGISEKLALPLMLRTTTRVNHTRSAVELGEMKTPKPRGTGVFEKDPLLVTVPSVARARHPILLKKIEQAEEMAENSPFNKIVEFAGKQPGAGNEKNENIGIITSGVAYCYVADVLRELGISMRVLKLGFTHPLPKKKCTEFIKSCDSVLVVEELEPYLEEQIKALAYEIGAKTKILGKGTGHFTRLYEYNTDIVRRGIEMALSGQTSSEVITDHSSIKLPSRPPILCPGCPHRATYYAVKQAAKGKNVIYPTDIGCYTLGRGPPLNMADYLLCMGSSVGTACGFSVATNNHIVAFLGDSTFFHAGIPPLVNAVHNKERFVLAILDNRTTAMTGHQPNPGTDKDGMGYEAPAISLENLVKGCGVEFVKTVDPRNLKETVQAFREALEFPNVSVIIAKSPCILLKGAASEQKYEVVQEMCKKCKICVSQFACPAFQMDKEQIKIDQGLCTGCAVCAQVCPFDAIKPVQPKGGAENRESRTENRESGLLSDYTRAECDNCSPAGELKSHSARTKNTEYCTEHAKHAEHAIAAEQTTSQQTDILLSGVGGQGTILAAKIIGDAALLAGKSVVVAEVHGMAQRGGSVECMVRIGEALGPIIPDGKADVIMGFEPVEVLRQARKCSGKTLAIMNAHRVVPFTVATGSEKYPSMDEIEQEIKKRCGKLVKLDAYEIACKAGAAVTANVVMVGALCGTKALPVPDDIILHAVKKNAPAKFAEMNEKAFRMGVEAARAIK